MNLGILNSVLQLELGGMFVVRESHARGTIHRYRDGWHFFNDVTDSHPCGRALIGYTFTDPQDVADFLVGNLRPLTNYCLVGERIET